MKKKTSITKLDSLKDAGWSTSRPSKPTELTKLEVQLNDLSDELVKLKQKKERNKNDTNAINQFNEKITNCKNLIKEWHCDSQKVEKEYYYDKAWKKQKIEN